MGIIIISTSQVNMTIINSEYEAIVDTQSRWLLLVIKGFSIGAWAVFFFFLAIPGIWQSCLHPLVFLG